MILLKDLLKEENLSWKQELYNKFPRVFADEILDERPKGDNEDRAEISNWNLSSNTPIKVSINDLLKNKSNLESITRTPKEVVDVINKKWKLNIVPGKVYDMRPERYFKYAEMTASTANPSVLVDGEIYWGVGRFIAALLRGDSALYVWNVIRN